LTTYACAPTVKQGQQDSEERRRMLSLETHQPPATTSTYRPFGWKLNYPKKSRPRKRHSGESRMHMSGYRYYSPGLGRWINRELADGLTLPLVLARRMRRLRAKWTM